MRAAVSFVLGFLLAAAIGAYLLYKVAETDRDELITYPPAQRYMGGVPGFETLTITGVLRGRDMRGRTHMLIRCVQEDKSCDMVETMQLGPSQVGVSDFSLPVLVWTPDKVEIGSGDAGALLGCNQVRIVYDRKADKAYYHRAPTLPRPAECGRIFKDTDSFTWEIANSPVWDTPPPDKK